MLKKLYLLVAILFCTFVFAQVPFIGKWQVYDGNITFRSIGSFIYKWRKANDVNVSGGGIGLTGTTTINVPSTGDYIVAITPDASFKFTFDYNGLTYQDRQEFIEIQQWGNIKWFTDLSKMFYTCSALSVTATDIPDFSNVTNMSYMFAQCYNVTKIPNANSWNTSQVTNMAGMFSFSNKFNEDIGQWNTSAVTNMSSMFSYASEFNQDVGRWNTSQVTDMSSMFSSASKFNQDISRWDVSKVSNMVWMFNQANSFNQNLGKWNIQGVYGFSSIFDNTNMSCDNYSKTLQGWATNPNVRTGVTLGALNITYGDAGKVYRDILVNQKSWNISGDFYDPTCSTVLVTKDVKLESVKISNPVKDFLIVQTTDNLEKIELYSVTGQLIKKISAKSLNVSELAKGVYILKIFTDKGMSTQKIIKE